MPHGARRYNALEPRWRRFTGSRALSKLLLFIVAAVVIYILIKGAARKRAARPGSKGAAAAESMVPCAQCGVNLPRSEALETGGRFYCSEEHRRLASG